MEQRNQVQNQALGRFIDVVRTPLEEDVRRKRQRIATEWAFEEARRMGIKLPNDAVAVPYRVRLSNGKGKAPTLRFFYVTFPEKITHLFCWDMAGKDINGNGGNKVFKFSNYCKLGEDVVLEEIPEFNPNKHLTPKIQMDALYSIVHWYNLEPLLAVGSFFDTQRKRTKLLSEFAANEGLNFKGRAKLGHYAGKDYWSLQAYRDGIPVYVIADMGTANFDVIEDDLQLWILQQRVASQMIDEYARRKGVVICSDCMLTDDGKAYWYKTGKAGDKYLRVCCNVVDGQMKLRDIPPFKEEDVLRAKQQAGSQFEVIINDIHFKAIRWTEMEMLSYNPTDDDDDE